ncbi:MAG: 50S ribosomal protein L19e [Nitrososphaerota archaeon]|nr:50S ribosomal protein L19e [Nitrososphaerota archaeon]
MAAEVLKVGVNRVRFDPESLDRISDSITRESIRNLIKEGVIWAAPVKGISRGRVRARAGRRQNAGSRKGAAGARQGKKELWVKRVRALRRYLKLAKERGEIDKDSFNKLYAHIKGGRFKTLRQLKEAIKKEVKV